jgi:hypothetical protein
VSGLLESFSEAKDPNVSRVIYFSIAFFSKGEFFFLKDLQKLLAFRRSSRWHKKKLYFWKGKQSIIRGSSPGLLGFFFFVFVFSDFSSKNSEPKMFGFGGKSLPYQKKFATLFLEKG